jgi:hypothetical protein
LGTDSTSGRVDTNPFHSGHINHKTTVANGFAGYAVATPSNGYENVVFASDTDTGDDIGSTSAADDDRGTAINHGVWNGASVVIAQISGTECLTAKRGLELLNGGFRDHSFLSQPASFA